MKTYHRNIYRFILAGLFTFFTMPAFSSGIIELNDVTATYQIDSGVEVTETTTVVVPAGDYFITLSAGGSSDFSQRKLFNGPDEMYYNIYSTGGTILRDLSANPSTNEVLSGTATNEYINWKRHNYDIIVDANQFPPTGTYTDTIDVSLYEGTLGNAQKTDSDAFTVSVTVDPILEMAVVQDNGSFIASDPNYALDFGILKAGEEKKVDLIVRSNRVYGVQVRSDNGGVMVNQDQNDESVVPYILYVNGSEQSLGAGIDEPLASNATSTSIDGAVYDLSVEIQDYGMATEGQYSDIITFTVLAQ